VAVSASEIGENPSKERARQRQSLAARPEGQRRQREKAHNAFTGGQMATLHIKRASIAIRIGKRNEKSHDKWLETLDKIMFFLHPRTLFLLWGGVSLLEGVCCISWFGEGALCLIVDPPREADTSTI
jgi:hypothetical protein